MLSDLLAFERVSHALGPDPHHRNGVDLIGAVSPFYASLQADVWDA